MYLPMPQKHKNNLWPCAHFGEHEVHLAKVESLIIHGSGFRFRPWSTLAPRISKCVFFRLVLGGIYCNLAHSQIGKAKMQIAAKSFNIPHKSGQKSPWVKQAFGKKRLRNVLPHRSFKENIISSTDGTTLWSSPIANSNQCTYYCDWASSFYANAWPNENAKGQGSRNQIKSLIDSGKFRVQTGFINNLWKPGQDTSAVVCLQRQWDIAILLVDLSCWIPWRQFWTY